MTEQQAQNIIAFLELARTAIDNAELKLVRWPDEKPRGIELIRFMSEIAAAARNLEIVGGLVKSYAEMIAEDASSASATNRVAP